MQRSKFTAIRARLMLAAVLLAGAGSARARDGTVVFFGDSLTAGYGLADPETEAYPALIQRKMDAAGLPRQAVNAGLSGETSSDGLSRVNWILRQPVGVFVLALGANDGLRGLPPELLAANLTAIIERVRAAQPTAKILLAGMIMPSSMGEDYVHRFAAVFPEVAKKEHVPLIPFLLEGVGGHPDLNQADGIHPTAAGDEIVAATVWRYLQPLLTGR